MSARVAARDVREGMRLARDVREVFPFGFSLVHRACAEHVGLAKPRRSRKEAA